MPQKGKVEDINTGDEYEGDLEDFELHGTGTMKFKHSGKVWKGQFNRGMVTGFGTMTWENGDLYKGTM